ncbi:hypothetical protein WKU33_18600 [Oceanobacillus sp. HCA-5259]|uniref:hypothetical protein n=1 Tax=Oceanobacillus sp. HCA-5259 TaxID=3134661 RepID=UPI0030C0E56B
MESNNICIYTKQPHDDAELKSGDHVILAAIGGQRKLPKSYVSHEANNYFSRLEKHFTRDSIISLVRQFEGPGKRGKLNIKKASKSKVNVMVSQHPDDESSYKYSLGYLELGKPYAINQFIFNLDDTNKNNILTSLNPILIKADDDPQQVLLSFIESVKKMENYILILDENMPENLALFGELENKWFLAINSNAKESLALDFIKHIQQSKSVTVNDSNKSSSQVSTHQSISFDFDITSRVIAKMVFNFLALEKGQEFILNSRFDSIRNWIYTGEGENNFVSIMESDNMMKKRFGTLYPDRSHYIFITQIDRELVGLIGFYGSTFSFSVKLTDLVPGEILLNDVCGLICDWKNRKEYSLMEYVLQLTQSHGH